MDVHISVYRLVGKSFCVTQDDAQNVYRCLADALAAGRRVTLSFRGVTCLTPTFLHAAIGQLYGVYAPEEIRSRLHVEDLELSDRVLLKHVAETAKAYVARLQAGSERERA